MRPRTSFVLFILFLSLIGAGTSSAAANTLRTGTIVHIRTLQPILADRDRPGTQVRGVVDHPVTSSGRVIIPRGARATLEVVDRSTNRNRVDLRVRSIRVGGTRVHISTNEVRLGSSARRGTRGLVGAGVGAAVGGMLGGGTGAAVGATTGAAMGLVSAGRGRTQLSVPAHTQLQFRVNRTTRVGR
jgi:hypothetical protein